MKTQLLRLTTAIRALLLLAGLMFLPTASRAATANPPDKMTYQGFLVDANGVPLGNSAPVNHTVEFRIYDASTGDNVKWDERQTVTVDKGYFSVMLGDGTPITTTGGLPLAFQGPDASDRFIGVKVTSLQGNPAEIVPRLRLVTSPYAYMANTLPPGAITNGLFAAGSITGDKLANNTITPANISSSVGLWTANGANVYRSSGNVGIGTPTPSAPLSLGTSVPANALKLALYDAPGDTYGLGIVGSGMTFHTSNAERMRITSVGNVGIGAAPGAKLHVYGNGGGEAGNTLVENAAGGDAYAMIRLRNDAGADGLMYKNSSTRSGDGGANTMTIRNDGGDLRLQASGGTRGLHVKASSGNVGIGTTTPTQAALVVEAQSGNVSIPGAYGGLGSGGVSTGVNANIVNMSIYASGNIVAFQFFSFSDERVKNVIGQSDSTADLQTLRGIKVTDYTYKDTIAKGSRSVKKIIAQQVERIYPQAVRTNTDVVPDIYQKASVENGWVQLATDLKVGERVKLVGEKGEGVHEVLEVRKGAFRTAFNPASDKVFVYGREVNDFRSVDYEAISMLNVSATQELARKVETQESELIDLRAELAKLRTEKTSLAASVTELKARDEAREARLARLEKALDSRVPVIEAKATTRDLSVAK